MSTIGTTTGTDLEGLMGSLQNFLYNATTGFITNPVVKWLWQNMMYHFAWADQRESQR